MDAALLIKFVSAFAFVIALMLLLSWAIKRAGWAGGALASAAGRRRLKIVEFMPIDHRRRLVLVRRDDREHLLLLGPQGETVVETGIEAAPGNVVAFAKDQKNAEA